MGFPKGYGRAEILNDSLLDPLGNASTGIEYTNTVTTVIEENARDITNVRLVADGNIPLDGSVIAIQGLSLAEGDVVASIAQISEAENGPYIVSLTGAWARLSDDPEEWRILHCREGDNAGTLYELATSAPILLGTTALQFRPVRAVPRTNSVTTGTIVSGAVTPEKLSFDPATQEELESAIAAHATMQASPASYGHVKPDGVTIVQNENGQLAIANTTSLQNIQLRRNGVMVAECPAINFIQGANISLSVALNGSTVDVTIGGAAAGVTGSGTAGRIPVFSSTTVLGDSRIAIATAAAMVEIPYIAGDARTTLRVGDANNAQNFRTAIEGYSYGGYGARFFSWVNHGLYGESGDAGKIAIYGVNTSGSGTGVQGDGGSAGVGVRGVTDSGVGVRGQSVTGKAIYGVSTSAGNGGDFETQTGRAVNATATGNGRLGYFYRDVNGANLDGITVLLDNAADNGVGVYVRHDGTGIVGYFDQQLSTATQSCVTISGRGSGVTLNVSTVGTGRAVYGRISNASSTADAGQFETNGTGNALRLSLSNPAASTTTTNNFLIGELANVRKWRVDSSGKGFFGGGTQVGGQDYAELLRVEGGDVSGFEPGDLVCISAVEEGAVVLSTERGNTFVAGVYSTRPGVLAVDVSAGDPTAEDYSAMIPVAFLGLVPLKVTSEGGEIHPRDWLMASSTPGHAMRAPDDADPRSLIGKAMSTFTTSGAGVISARINVK